VPMDWIMKRKRMAKRIIIRGDFFMDGSPLVYIMA
jgi:hypothetical protein